MHLSIFCPRGGAWGGGGDFDFLKKIWVKIPTLGHEIWIKIPTLGHKLLIKTVCINQNPLPGAWSCDQNPHPRATFPVQNPHPCPTLPPGAKYWQVHNYVCKPLHQRVMTMPHYDQPLVAMATVKMWKNQLSCWKHTRWYMRDRASFPASFVFGKLFALKCQRQSHYLPNAPCMWSWNDV